MTDTPKAEEQWLEKQRDKIWDDIRSTLCRCAMKNMTIPQAEVFSAEASLYIGSDVRGLVDMEIKAITSHYKSLMEEAVEEAEKRVIAYAANPAGRTKLVIVHKTVCERCNEITEELTIQEADAVVPGRKVQLLGDKT